MGARHFRWNHIAALLVGVALAFPARPVVGQSMECPEETLFEVELQSADYHARVCIGPANTELQPVTWILTNKTPDEQDVTFSKDYVLACGNPVGRPIDEPIRLPPHGSVRGGSGPGQVAELQDFFTNRECQKKQRIKRVGMTAIKVRKVPPPKVEKPAVETRSGGLMGRLAADDTTRAPSPAPQKAAPSRPKMELDPPKKAAPPQARVAKKPRKPLRGPGDTWRISLGFGAGFAILPVYSHTYGEEMYDDFETEPTGGYSMPFSFEWWPLYWKYFGVGMNLQAAFAASFGFTYNFGGGLRAYAGHRPTVSVGFDLTRLWQGALDRSHPPVGSIYSRTVESDEFVHNIWRVSPGLVICTGTRHGTCQSALTLAYFYDGVVDYGGGHGFGLNYDLGFLGLDVKAFPTYPTGNREGREDGWLVDFSVSYKFTWFGND